MDFPRFNFQREILLIGSMMGGALRFTVDGGGMEKGRGGALPAHGAQDHRCLPAVAREGEEDEAKLVRGSPEHERRRKGGATAAAQARCESKEEHKRAGREGRRCSGGRGPLGVYIGAGEGREGGNVW
jgi:hypothetical protein